MNIEGYRQTFYDFSGKASDLSRQLAFAGIALTWVFKTENAGQMGIPEDLIYPSTLVVLSLALDILHYTLGSFIWYRYYRWLENKETPETEEVEHSVWLTRPMDVLFWAKVVCVIGAYALYLAFLWKQFF